MVEALAAVFAETTKTGRETTIMAVEGDAVTTSSKMMRRSRTYLRAAARTSRNATINLGSRLVRTWTIILSLEIESEK